MAREMCMNVMMLNVVCYRESCVCRVYVDCAWYGDVECY